MTTLRYTPHPSPKLLNYFQDYAVYHQTFGNRLTHYFGISFIVISLLGLLSHIPTFLDPLNGGIVLVLLSSLFYLSLDWKIALPFAGLLIGIYFLGSNLPLFLLWALFIGGWVLQGIGHILYEKKSPAFTQNLIHLWIGPLWIFAKLTCYLRS